MKKDSEKKDKIISKLKNENETLTREFENCKQRWWYKRREYDKLKQSMKQQGMSMQDRNYNINDNSHITRYEMERLERYLNQQAGGDSKKLDELIVALVIRHQSAWNLLTDMNKQRIIDLVNQGFRARELSLLFAEKIMVGQHVSTMSRCAYNIVRQFELYDKPEGTVVGGKYQHNKIKYKKNKQKINIDDSVAESESSENGDETSTSESTSSDITIVANNKDNNSNNNKNKSNANGKVKNKNKNKQKNGKKTHKNKNKNKNGKKRNIANENLVYVSGLPSDYMIEKSIKAYHDRHEKMEPQYLSENNPNLAVFRTVKDTLSDVLPIFVHEKQLQGYSDIHESQFQAYDPSNKNDKHNDNSNDNSNSIDDGDIVDGKKHYKKKITFMARIDGFPPRGAAAKKMTAISLTPLVFDPHMKKYVVCALCVIHISIFEYSDSILYKYF